MRFNIFTRRERRKDRSELPVKALKKLLEHFAREGEFKVAMMATEKGFISVNIDSKLGTGQLSAIARIVWKFSRILHDQKLLKDIQHILLCDKSGEEGMICHSFEIQKQMIVLIILTSVQPPQAELIEKATKGISRIMAE